MALQAIVSVLDWRNWYCLVTPPNEVAIAAFAERMACNLACENVSSFSVGCHSVNELPEFTAKLAREI